MKKQGSWVVFLIWLCTIWPIAIWYYWQRNWDVKIVVQNKFKVNNIKFSTYLNARQYCEDNKLLITKIKPMEAIDE